MSKSNLLLFIFVSLVFLIALSLGASAVCTNLTDNAYITSSKDYCGLTYNFNDTNTNGIFAIAANTWNLDVNFNKAIINSTADSYTLLNTKCVKWWAGNNTNVAIRNINCIGHYTGVTLQTNNNATLTNITVSHTNSSGMYLGAMSNFTARYLNISNNIRDHALYVDALTAGKCNNIDIGFSEFAYSVDNTVQFNSANVDWCRGVLFHDNYIHDVSPNLNMSAINDIGTAGALFYNNRIERACGIDIAYNQAGAGINYSSRNATYYNNTFVNQVYTSSCGGFAINNATSGTLIRDNIWSDNLSYIWFNIPNSNFSIREPTVQFMQLNWYTGRLNLNYSGTKNISINNRTLTISDLPSTSPSYNLLNGSVNMGYLTQSSLPYTLTVGSGENWKLDSDTCVVPYEDYTVNTSITLCPGTYNLNDTNGNGAIIINANNVVLDCGGATLIGNNTPSSLGIYTLSKSNVTITNCNLKAYNRAVGLRNTQNDTIYNNNITNNKDRGITCLGQPCAYLQIYDNYLLNATDLIWLEDTNSSSVYRNTLINSSNSGISGRNANFINLTNNNITKIAYATTDTGISFDKKSRFNTISNNNIMGWQYGIRLKDNSTNCNITYNNVNGSGTWGITAGDNANFSLIYKNNIYNSQWNAISFQSYFNTISDNFISGYFLHHGIDTHDDANRTVGGNTSIFNNIIEETQQSIGGYGIFIGNSNGNSVYNNTLRNLFNTSFLALSFGRGIAIESGDYALNNIIENNSLINISGYCLYDDSYNTIWRTNNLLNCEASAKVFGAWNYANNISYPLFVNNLDDKNVFLFQVGARTNLNYTTNMHTSIFNATNPSGSNVSVFNLTAPYNDIYDVSNGVVLAYNKTVYYISLQPGQKIYVGEYGNNWTPLLSISASSAPIFGLQTTVTGVGCPAELNCTMQFNGINVTSSYTFVPSSASYLFNFLTSGNINYSAKLVSYQMNISNPGGSEQFGGGGNALPPPIVNNTPKINNTIPKLNITGNQTSPINVTGIVDYVEDHLPDFSGIHYTQEQLENLALAAFFVLFIIVIIIINSFIK